MVNEESPQVLLVTNYGEEGLISDVAEILKSEGHKFDFAIGRDDALEKINRTQYRAVYIGNSDLNLDSGEGRESLRMPEKQDFQRVGIGQNRLAIRIASMFELTRKAREKGLGVVVVDQGDFSIVTENIRRLGAIPIPLLTTDAYDKYQAIAQYLR